VWQPIPYSLICHLTQSSWAAVRREESRPEMAMSGWRRSVERMGCEERENPISIILLKCKSKCHMAPP
jgi:hypothetical protein